MMQIHVEADIKAYLKTKECRRKHILRSFAVECTHAQPLHRCCDNCAQLCEYKSAECDNNTTYPALKLQTTYISSQVRNDIAQEQRQKVKEELIIYRKELVRNLMSNSPGENLTSIINPRFLLGFSTLQINQVMDNLKNLFSIKDITSLVEIWDMKHAYRVQQILNTVFCDIGNLEGNGSDSESSEDDEDNFDVWADSMSDENMMEFLSDSLNMLEVEESLQTTASSLGPDTTLEQVN